MAPAILQMPSYSGWQGSQMQAPARIGMPRQQQLPRLRRPQFAQFRPPPQYGFGYGQPGGGFDSGNSSPFGGLLGMVAQLISGLTSGSGLGSLFADSAPEVIRCSSCRENRLHREAPDVLPIRRANYQPQNSSRQDDFTEAAIGGAQPASVVSQNHSQRTDRVARVDDEQPEQHEQRAESRSSARRSGLSERREVPMDPSRRRTTRRFVTPPYGVQPALWRLFEREFRRCASDCVPTEYISKGHRGNRSCHPTGWAIDMMAIKCSDGLHHALEGGRFKEVVKCMDQNMFTMYQHRPITARRGTKRFQEQLTAYHYNNAHFSPPNGCGGGVK
jgi:hypothetical protein